MEEPLAQVPGIPALEGSTKGARRATEVEPSRAAAAAGGNGTPDPEVAEKPKRRTYTAQYKRRILDEADRAEEPGAVGALLRREGLYSSHLITWRRQRDEGVLAGLSKKRGRKPRPFDPFARRIVELERDNERLRKDLAQAETIIEIQKKLSSLLGVPLSDTKNNGKA